MKQETSHELHIFLKNNLGMANRCFIICLVLSLCATLSLSDDVFISIDCGSSTPSKDNGISWEGDDKYVQNGESRSVKPSYSLSPVADTLRVFTTQKKNCYHVNSVRRGRVLVRATFYYGNYDGKNSPPTFALQFDGNEWTDVETSTTNYYYNEVTYVTKRDSISVCLAQTKAGQFPFITTLEVRSLESYMYDHVKDIYPLFLLSRVAFGSNTSIRYKDDHFDRIWSPANLGNGSIRVSSDAVFSEEPSPDDTPPPAVLKNAITAKSPNTSIELLIGFPSNPTPVIINWYFSEVTSLQPNQNRSFTIFKDNESFYDLPILPPYGNCIEISSNVTVASSKTTFSLVPTNFSTLPPLINAMEAFQIGLTPLTDGTDKKDVQGLASLQDSFTVLRVWSGDPCLPANYSWDWIKCSVDPMPRVTALFLGGYGLSGLLPDFSSMDALEIIDVHNNSLQGPVPGFLGSLPNLETLNLANNQFNGTIPASLSTKKGLLLTVDGNPGLCTSKSCPVPAVPRPNSSTKKKKNILELFIAVTIASKIIF